MKTITKKSLEELAKTMNVIPEEERDDYWGMYDNDCFWRCVAFLESGSSDYTGIVDEAVAESYAYGFFISDYGGGSSGVNQLSGENNAEVTGSHMNNYLSDSTISTDQIYVFSSDVLNKPEYGYNGSANHAILKIGTTSNNDAIMYDPQLGGTFVMSESDLNKNIYKY